MVMGFAEGDPTPEQQQQMQDVIRLAMEEGAVGMSSGLTYTPGMYAQTEELAGLCRTVGSWAASTHPITVPTARVRWVRMRR